MKKQYPYSNDKEFLSKIDMLHVKEQWVKIILLEYNSENPIDSIEGKITGGTLTKAGDSSVRRTCNLTCVVDTFKYNIDDIQANYSISKKIYLELGITNDTTEYPEEDIIWFPQGVFFITSFGVSASATGAVNISLQFKDKIAQLDGTVGGVLPSTVRFDTMSTVVNGVIVTNKVLVYDIIMELVNHFGNEDISNIIIDDIPTKAKRIIRWMGAEPVWIYPIASPNGVISYDICFDSDLDEKRSAHTPINNNGKIISAKKYTTGQDIGYMYEDFVYDTELTFKAGSKVTDVLDKIKQWLGNYEYFYDDQGQFHFQEIKNYLNNTQSAYIWDKIVETNDADYLYESIDGKTVYTFSDDVNLISITNTPVYENIKNDYIVEGTVTNNNITRTCRYHLVIDDKPTVSGEGYDNVLIYTDPSTGASTLAKPEIITPQYNSVDEKYIWSLPEFAEDGKVYGLLDEAQIFTASVPVTNIENFATYYNDLVDQEHTLITEDNSYELSTEVKDYLFALLEKYMGYQDDTAYKETYRKTIFTLARQLCRYNVAKQDPQLATTLEYYESLYGRYIIDVSNYGPAAKEYISWCGELLRLLYNLFNGITTSHRPSSNYTDSSYWPAINTTILKLWEDMDTSNSTQELRNLRRTQCWRHINTLNMKQPQLAVLIEQYGQIINNYNVQIKIYENKNNPTQAELNKKNQLIQSRNSIQDQIKCYKEQQDVCNKRLNMLYAALTVLGTPSPEIGEVYFSADINIPVRASSFWYYDIDTSKDTYGWNELEWYKYYRTRDTGKTEYYPDGLGSMTYIDYSKLDWGSFNFMDLSPSMNRYSDWYKNYYVDYAIENKLSYFAYDDNGADRYIPFNWRTELLLRGLLAEENGTDPGYYYQELKANLPTVYDFKTSQLLPSSISALDYFVGNTGVILGDSYKFITDDFNTTSSKAQFKSKDEAAIENWVQNFENGSYYYFFDMIDSSSPVWGEYSVSNIGRRTNVTANDSINCIFAPEIPNYAFLNVSNMTTDDRRKAYMDLENISEEIIQVTNIFHKNFATSLSKQPAYEQIKYDLQQHTSYQNVVSITALPCFYLEPNTLVELNDRSTNTYGEYVVKSISIPLGIGSAMSVSMSKAMGRL